MIKKQAGNNRLERPSYFWLYSGLLICLVVVILVINTAFTVWLPTGNYKQIERMTAKLIELRSENNKQFLRLVRLRAEKAEIDNESRVYKQVIAEVIKKCE